MSLQIVGHDVSLTPQEMEAELAAISRSQATIAFALDGTIICANENYQRLTGYSLHDMLGRNHTMFLPPGEGESTAYHAFWAALRSGDFRDGEFKRITKDGSEIYLRASYSPILDAAGKPFKVVKFAVDVTPQVLIREQFRRANAELSAMARDFAKSKTIAEEASRAKTRFLAGMSHELRTPLNGILGHAQLLHMEGGLTPPQAKRIQAMMQAGNHLLEMITCVLDLSEIESGEAGLHTTTMDIACLAEASLAIVRAAAEKKGLDLSLEIEPGLPPLVIADTAKMRQVLLNLLGNAVKYTPRGHIELRICAVEAMAMPPAFKIGAPQLRFLVTDTGPGIPKNRRLRLFEDFERLNADDNGITEGAGLGLSLSKRLASVMDGTLSYQDNPAGGSIFVLEIPLVAAPAEPASADAARKATPPPKEPPKGRNARILVVDDVAMNRDIASAFLTSAGYEVVCADGGEAGVQEAADNDFLAIMMDVRMPVVDGLEATRRIRALGGPRGDVPVVALTAQVFTEQVQACQAAGMDTHVGKPFTLENLLGAVTRVVDSRQAGKPAPAGDTIPIAAPALPVLDRLTLERTAALLNGSSMRSFLDTLTTRAEELRKNLVARNSFAETAGALAEAAHKLAGSAGMFGFDRLAHIAKDFEHAVKAQSPDAEALADDLDSVLVASLSALRSVTLPPGAAVLH